MNEQNLSAASSIAGQVVSLCRAKGRTSVAIDGRSGAGKTDLAQAIVAELENSATGAPQATIVRLDSIYPGWSGIEAAVDLVLDTVLKPRMAGQSAEYSVFDWPTMSYLPPIAVPEAEILILEGCGAGALRLAAHIDLLVWVEAPPNVRQTRAFARDGDTFRPWWSHWANQEDLHYQRNGTRERANMVVATDR